MVRFPILLALGVSSCCAQVVTVPAGTTIPLVLDSALASRTAQRGDAVRAETSFPVAVEGRVAIPRGTYVEGVVDKVRRRGRNAGFDIHFTRLIFADGYTVSLEGESQLPRVASALRPAGSAPSCAASAAFPGELPAPTLTPPPQVGPSKGLIIGIGGAATAGLVVAGVLLTRRGVSLYLDTGTAFQMKLANPLPLEVAKLPVAAAPGP